MTCEGCKARKAALVAYVKQIAERMWQAQSQQQKQPENKSHDDRHLQS